MNFEPIHNSASCVCFLEPHPGLIHTLGLGMDEHFAEISLLRCLVCGQLWLRYFFEVEAFTASGCWYLGAVTPEEAARLEAGNAKAVLESLPWYFYGGSHYGGRVGRMTGPLDLFP